MFSGFKYSLSTLSVCILCLLIPYSCTDTEEPDCCEEMPSFENTPFDRKALLESWADDIIIPSFERYVKSLTVLNDRATDLTNDPSMASLENLRESWLAAYSSWQSVSMFDIGMAETIGLRNFTNIFPTDVDKINETLNRDSYNLGLPSNFVVQGFPALDYLLFAFTGEELMQNKLVNTKYTDYISTLTERLLMLSSDVLSDWKSSYRDEFIRNDASSATGSVDKLVNDALFYYEKFLRAGKIGIPAGVFSGTPISDAVEAPFSKIYSKQLFLAGLGHFKNFLNGELTNGTISDTHLGTYLDAVNAEKDGTALITLMNKQLDEAKLLGERLSDNFQDQVETDNIKMLQTYDELQKAVVLLKVDMLQALNIKVDFVDADGD